MVVLDHERLDVYRTARTLSREVCRLRKKLRPGRRDLVDQLLRATSSVALNIAEGNGERGPRRRAYFFRCARSSTTEVAAALDHMVDMQLLVDTDTHRAKGLAVRIVSMLIPRTDAAQTQKRPLPRANRNRTRTRARARTRPFDPFNR